MTKEPVFPGLYHTAWTVRDGAPPDINDLTQTRDGYLWLSTKNGLYSFDGVRFERFQNASGPGLLSEDVYALLALPDGGLWISYAFGGASLLKGGRLINYGKDAGLGADAISMFARSPEGEIWAATEDGLKRLEGDHWRVIGTEAGFMCPTAESLTFDKYGTLWVSCVNTIVFLRRGETQFRDTKMSFNDEVELATGPDNTKWTAGIGGTVIPLRSNASNALKTGPPIGLRSLDTLVDRNGRLWVATTSAGLRCIFPPVGRSWVDRSPATTLRMESFTREDGLSSNEAKRLLQDTEGNMWVATASGLDRFRRTKLTNVLIPSGVSGLTIAPFERGSILVSTGAVPPGIERVGRSEIQALPGAPAFLTSAYRDQDGSFWFGGMNSLWHFASKRFTPVALPPSLPRRVLVQAISRSPSGDLWVSFMHNHLFRLTKNVWTEYGHQQGWPDDNPLIMTNDRAGRLWFGYEDNRIAVLKDERLQLLTQADGLNVGRVTAITEHAGQVWVGGSSGLQLFDGSRFHATGVEPQYLKGVTGIVETTSGDLWLSVASGIVRIEKAEVAAFEKDHDHQVRSQLLDVLDGVPGTPYPGSRLPSAVESLDGVLWFATGAGLTWIDPKDIFRNSVVPPVYITSIQADGQNYSSFRQLELPKGTKNIQIDYTALSLSMPERVRFRYKLDGFDKEWLDAGARRQAFYSQIPPGAYRFEVLACNDADKWNEIGASASFTVAPTFIQSTAFKVLCAAALAGMLWSFYLIRLRQVTAQVHTRLYDRLAERERIARDLHDTFFQGIQGLLLRFQTGTRQLKENEPTRLLFEETLRQSDQVMLEGRELVLDLRSGASHGEDLSREFSLVIQTLQDLCSATLEIVVKGTPRAIHPIVQEELYRFGKEALNNAARHSNATRIETELSYESGHLRLSIRDDGIGIDPAILSNGYRADHWGLPGMKERARKIGAHLDIWSREGAGTEIDIRVPAHVAYQEKTKISHVRRFLYRRVEE